MKIYLAVLAVLGAFVLEWSVNAMLAGKAFFAPLSALVFCLLGWRMKLVPRLWLGLATGVIADTVQLVPFGSFLLTYILLSLLCEAFRTFFSNTEAHFTQGIGAALLLLVFAGSVPWFIFVLTAFT